MALLGILGMSIILGFVIITALKKLVINPLKTFERGLDEFFLFLQGKQEFTKHIEIKTDDEFGQMATSLNENIAVSARLHEELNSLYSELEEKVEIRTRELAQINKEVQDSIEYASTIQRSFLKDASIIEQTLSDSFVVWQPRDKVGGDLYIYEESDEGIIFGVVDCTGHSVPGGFMTMLAGSMIKKLSNDYFNDPAKLLSELNIAIKKQLNQDVDNSLSDDGLDMGLCYINREKTLLKFAGAKMDLLYFKDKEQYIVKSNKQSIGYKRSKSDYEYINHEIHIDSSESFYLYSDGITDQTGGEKNFPYGNRKFKTFLREIQDKPMVEQEELIVNNLLHYQQDNTRRDDITIIGFKIKKDESV
jgi:serine phosphatase RsbU (regulator of sigma subunit)